MSKLGADLAAKARRVVIVQLAITAIVALLFLVQGAWDALSAVYGGVASVFLALLSIRGFKRANEHALNDPKKSMLILYIGAVQRFVAVVVLLAIGLGGLKLEPLAVFIGFALAQASYLMGVRDGGAKAKAMGRPD